MRDGDYDELRNASDMFDFARAKRRVDQKFEWECGLVNRFYDDQQDAWHVETLRSMRNGSSRTGGLYGRRVRRDYDQRIDQFLEQRCYKEPRRRWGRRSR